MDRAPKLYTVIEVEFWATRGGVGASLGYVEYDAKVRRSVRRVLSAGDPVWQIVEKFPMYDYMIDSDQEHLNDCELEDLELVQ